MQESLQIKKQDRKGKGLLIKKEIIINRLIRKSLALKENVSTIKEQAILRKTT
jgi:hypothetical protein